ncbi:MAG: ATP-binding cassette domain-containing protein [Bacteroidales bacterium]|nr:ATP-binding cassette domain-containing protein [Bacteroidales bacterium]MDT8373214.1 ATP-binding cassette domain-containing protein [Bacteroidales bacterium]
MSILFNIESLTAGYDDKVVLRDITMSVEENDFIGIIGPNGGGKTTLLKVILGLLKPFSGKVDFSPGTLRYNQIGYMPQVALGDTLFPVTVEDVVLSGMMHGKGARGSMGRNDKKHAVEIMEQLGLTTLARQPLNELSGGQLQRVYLARAVSGSPRLLLLDEPATYVDNSFEADFYDRLRLINERMTIMMVSHDVGMISSWVKSFACVNGSLFYHPHSKITEEDLRLYSCPIQLVTHGDVPHIVLHKHE